MTKFFFHKIKIAQNVGFPHRFSFSGQKVTPMGLPDASGPPLAFGCLGRGRMGLESQRMTFWDPFRSHHVCLSVVLVYQDFCTFLAQPNVYMYIGDSSVPLWQQQQPGWDAGAAYIHVYIQGGPTLDVPLAGCIHV